MIEDRLQEFMDKVSFKNEKLCEYVNKEKGLRYPFNTAQLLCRVDKLELDTRELDTAKFQQKIEKKDYKTVDIIKHVPKSDITKLDADKFTITDKKTKGSILYNVSNQLGIHNTYESQEEAFKVCEDINNMVYEWLNG